MTKKENEQIARLQTDICWIKKILGNHLAHHWYATMALLTALLGLVAAFIKIAFLPG